MDRKALRFWTDVYKAGCRIIYDGNDFTFEIAYTYMQRCASGGFGRFHAAKPIEPEQWIYQGLEEHEEGLLSILNQKPPKQYSRFFYHLLVLDYEVKPIERHALGAGHSIRGIGVDGGQFLWYEGTCTPLHSSPTPEPPPILAHLERMVI